MFRVLRPYTTVAPRVFADRVHLGARATPRPALSTHWVRVNAPGTAPRLELRWQVQDDQAEVDQRAA